MGFLGRLFGLGGGGSRARKHDRRLPRTVAALKRSYDGQSKRLTWKRGDIEDASWQSNYGGHIHKYKTKILPDTIVPGKTCVYFVTEAQGDIPPDMREKPYEVTKLCNGGMNVTGMVTTGDRARAARTAADKAFYERHGRFPPLRGARRR